MGCAASTGPLYRDEHDFATTAAYYDKDEDVKKDWTENEQLGEGMFARVVKITRKSTNQQYACKVLRKTTVIEDNEIKLAPKASDLLREIDCLRRVGNGPPRGARDGRHGGGRDAAAWGFGRAVGERSAADDDAPRPAHPDGQRRGIGRGQTRVVRGVTRRVPLPPLVHSKNLVPTSSPGRDTAPR